MNHRHVNVFPLLAFIALAACGGPSNFVRAVDTNWHNIEMRDGVTYDEAWKTVVDLTAQKFDIEVVSQDSAYLRTAWDHRWTGEYKDNYAVRATIKFSPDRRVIQVKSEALYKGQTGEDERLTRVLKTDIMGKLGRVTR